MNLESFKRHVISIAVLLEQVGQPATLEDCIFWHDPWFRKYELTKEGRYDA